MDMTSIEAALQRLIDYIESQQFKGYDPYDTLKSKINFSLFSKWGPILAIQLQKRNPINIRKLLGIKEDYNPKGLGLLLQAYSLLYKENKQSITKEKMDFLFNLLRDNYSKGYSGYCWGYNFDWVNPEEYIKAYTPSVVVTAFAAAGIHEYYLVSGDRRALDILKSCCDFILKDLPIMKLGVGISFPYTQQSRGFCYNATLLGAELLARVYSLTGESFLREYIKKATDLVLAQQKPDGRWNYSLNPETGTERKQVDFHQGFILCSLDHIIGYVNFRDHQYLDALMNGTEFYYKEQFYKNGRSKWRLPKIWPVEIHNQAQGIITFSHLGYLDHKYMDFASIIAEWTIKHMQDKSGYFYYRKHRFYTNKIPYMRWSQAWMMLALVKLLEKPEIKQKIVS